jgi:homoserine acetyltransferase
MARKPCSHTEHARPRVIPKLPARRPVAYRSSRRGSTSQAPTPKSFDLRGQLSAIRAPLLMVMSRSDQVFSPALAREFAPLLDAAGVPWSYLELDSEKGHLASGADAAMWSDTLRRFMDTPPETWVSWGLRP